ncbi:MAG: hypothetical protein QW332_06125 [Thermoproteota archaeon]
MSREKELIEIFTEYEVYVSSRQTVKGKNGGRLLTFKIVPKQNRKRITIESLMEYVNKLNARYPEEGFTLVKKGKYYVLTKNKLNSTKPNVPIYFDLEKQKFYIERRSTQSPAITNYIIMRTLGALGVSQSKYVRSETIRNEL